MHCEDVRDTLIDPTAHDSMSPDPAVREHLVHCPRCREEFDRLARTWSWVLAVPEDESNWPAMRARFAATLDRYRSSQAGNAQDSRHGPSRLGTWRIFASAAALVAAFVGGFLMGRGNAAGVDTVAAQSVHSELRDVRAMLALSLLQQVAASQRIKGLSAVAQMADPPADVLAAVVDTLLHDSNVNVRVACVRALEGRTGDTGIRGAVLRAIAREESPVVAIALIDLVVAVGDAHAADVLRQVSADTGRHEVVRERAAQALDRLTSATDGDRG